MNNKRTLEREIIHIQPPQPENNSRREREEHTSDDKAVRLGIVTDRTYVTMPSPLSTVSADADHVWLFIPARTSKRSLQNLAETCGSQLVRFYVRVRCLINYVYSDMDVAYQLNDDGRYYMLPSGTFADLQVHVVSPEQNPEVLRYVRAQTVVPPVPIAEPGV